MKVILLAHVKGLGEKGSIQEVSPGYFQNFLKPRRLADQATSTKVAHVQAQQAKAEEKLEALKESAQSIHKKTDGKSIALTEKVNESGALYAAISKKEIAAALKEQLKVSVPASNIQMDTIKTTGEFTATLKLHKEVEATLIIHVLAQE